MKYQRFLSSELYLMSALVELQPYGVPDPTEFLPEKHQAEMFWGAVKTLSEKKVIAIDVDGNMSLSEGYDKFLKFCCACDKFLSVECYTREGDHSHQLFWKLDENYLMADVREDIYSFSYPDAKLILAYLSGIYFRGVAVEEKETVLIQPVLRKAARLAAEGQNPDALRALRQGGATEVAAVTILDAMQKKADAVSISVSDCSKSIITEETRGWIGSRNLLLAAGQRVENYRTCFVFSPTESETAKREFEKLVSAFLTSDK